VAGLSVFLHHFPVSLLGKKCCSTVGPLLNTRFTVGDTRRPVRLIPLNVTMLGFLAPTNVGNY